MPIAITELVQLTAFTLGVAALATALALVPGVALGYALSRRSWRGRSLVEALVTLPLVLPPTAVGLALLLTLGPDGPVGALLERWLGLEIAFTWKAVVVAGAVVGLPLLVRSARGAFEELDPTLVGVARTLGTSPWGAFRRIELPLAWRGVLSGAVLCFARALGEFGATVLLAGNIPGRTQTLALAIFQRVQTGREREALALAGVAAALAFLALLVTEVLARRRERSLDR